jgi:hypothetical protein
MPRDDPLTEVLSHYINSAAIVANRKGSYPASRQGRPVPIGYQTLHAIGIIASFVTGDALGHLQEVNYPREPPHHGALRATAQRFTQDEV